jgi:hypothetical protein
VREVYNDPKAYVTPYGDRWVVWASIDGDPVKDGVSDEPTEPEALAKAWLAGVSR